MLKRFVCSASAFMCSASCPSGRLTVRALFGARRPTVLALSVFGVLAAPVMAVGQPATSQALTSDPSSALRFAPPLGPAPGSSAPLDRSLEDFLAVRICARKGSTCDPVTALSSGKAGDRRLRLTGNHYQVNWSLGSSGVEAGGTYRLSVEVAGLLVGSLELQAGGRPTSPDVLVVNPRQTLPVKFTIANHPAIRTRVLHAQGKTAVEVADVLRAEFGVTAGRAVELLLSDSYSAAELGQALKQSFGASATEAVQILSGLRLDAVAIGQALKFAYGATAAESAGILRSAGFLAEQIGQALNDVYNLVAQAAADVLKGAGFLAEQVGQALKDVYNATGEAAAAVLKAAGYAAEGVVSALKQAYQWTIDQVIASVAGTLFAVCTVSLGLAVVFGQNDRELATAFVRAVPVYESRVEWAAEALKCAFLLPGRAVAAILKELGIAAAAIGKALKAVYDATAEFVAGVLKDVGFAAEQVAQALIDAYNFAADQAAELLKAVGYAAEAIGQALKDVYNLGADAVRGILEGVDFLADEIGGALCNLFGTRCA